MGAALSACLGGAGAGRGGRPPAAKQRAGRWGATGVCSLRGEGRRELPAEAGPPVAGRLRVLDAGENRLRDLPEWAAGGLPRLQRLSLDRNLLVTLPRDCRWGALRTLLLAHNEITALDLSAGAWAALGRLEVLDLSHNALVSLPPEAAELPALRELRVSHNALVALPEALGDRAPALRELDVRNNEIEVLPRSFGTGGGDDASPSTSPAPPLRTLLADGNRLQDLPPRLFVRFESLHQISLHGNPNLKAAAVEQMEGFAAYEERRRGRVNKGLAGGALLGPGGFDEGLDRELLGERRQ